MRLNSLLLVLFLSACGGNSVRYVEVPGDAGTMIRDCADDSDCPSDATCGEDGVCVRDRIVERGCESMEDCDDGALETTDACVDGVCHHTYRPLPYCPIAVTRNNVVPDRRESDPIVAGSAGQVIATYTVSATCEDVDITQVFIHDLVGAGDADTAADFFANLIVSGAFEPFGFLDPIENLTDVPGTVYFFTPAEPIRIPRDSTLLLQHQVDVLRDFTGNVLTVNGFPPFAVEIWAVGVESGMEYRPIEDNLQHVWLAKSGTLAVELDPSSPGPRQLVMGATDERLLCVDFNATLEDARICGLTFHVEHEEAPRILRNLRLNTAGGERVSETLFGLDANDDAVFGADSCLDYRVRVGELPVLCLHAGTIPWLLGGLSGANFRVVLRAETPGEDPSVVAEGLVSGNPILGDRLRQGAENFDIPSPYFTTYRTVVSVELAPGSPSGARSPAIGQTVAVFRIYNTANPGNYEAEIQRLNFDIGTTLQRPAASRPQIQVYRDSVSPGNLLASAVFDPDAGGTSWMDADIPDFTIASGAHRDIIVTLDTNQLSGAPGSSRSLTVSMTDLDAIRWSDGLSEVEWTEGLPIAGNTLLYSF